MENEAERKEAERKAWESIHAHTEARIQKAIDEGKCERCVKYGHTEIGKPTERLNYSSFFIICERCKKEMDYEWSEHWKQVQEEIEEEKRAAKRHYRVMSYYEEYGHYPGPGFDEYGDTPIRDYE
jgi:Fe2+ or Zn2+ uptake regulation protein